MTKEKQEVEKLQGEEGIVQEAVLTTGEGMKRTKGLEFAQSM